MSKQQASTPSNFYCVFCSSKGIPIMRKRGQERETSHLKRIYCLKCMRETNHAEIRENTDYSYEDFLMEFNYNNFDKDGMRKKPYKQFLSELRKELNIDG